MLEVITSVLRIFGCHCNGCHWKGCHCDGCHCNGCHWTGCRSNVISMDATAMDVISHGCYCNRRHWNGCRCSTCHWTRCHCNGCCYNGCHCNFQFLKEALHESFDFTSSTLLSKTSWPLQNKMQGAKGHEYQANNSLRVCNSIARPPLDSHCARRIPYAWPHQSPNRLCSCSTESPCLSAFKMFVKLNREQLMKQALHPDSQSW